MFDAHALHYLTFLLMMPLWQCASQWPAKKKAENQQNVIKAAAKSRNNKNKNKACCWNLRFYANANEGRKANAYTYIPTNIYAQIYILPIFFLSYVLFLSFGVGCEAWHTIFVQQAFSQRHFLQQHILRKTNFFSFLFNLYILHFCAWVFHVIA